MSAIQRVESSTGKVHAVGKGLLTRCGILFGDLFATYEYGTMWPPTQKPVTCKRCAAAS